MTGQAKGEMTVGALITGAGVVEVASPDKEIIVARPPGEIPEGIEMFADIVQTNLLRPFLKCGDVIYVGSRAGAPPADFIGELITARLDDGRRFFGKLAFGSRTGLYTIDLLPGESIRDVVIEKIFKLTWTNLT